MTILARSLPPSALLATVLAADGRETTLPDDSAALVAAARGGSREALAELLRQSRPPLVRLLTGMLGDAAAAEDAAQEALLHACSRLHQLRGEDRFYPWLRRSAVRMALKRRPVRETPLHEAPELSARRDGIGAAETRLSVEQLLAGMLPDLRVVLILRELEELDYQEIAAELGWPLGTVRSRLHRARDHFRRQWQAALEEAKA